MSASAMIPREFFDANLDTIERVIGVVCRRARLVGADAEDSASEVQLALSRTTTRSSGSIRIRGVKPGSSLCFDYGYE